MVVYGILNEGKNGATPAAVARGVKQAVMATVCLSLISSAGLYPYLIGVLGLPLYYYVNLVILTLFSH